MDAGTTAGWDEEVAVIGAGAAGLAAAAELGRRRVRALVLEREARPGTSWERRYDGLRLNTVSWMSALRGARIPRRHGRWPAREHFAAYLRDYARRQGIRVRAGVAVERVERVPGGHRLETSGGRLTARFVVVATGYDREPFMPSWPGRDGFAGELLHSSEYRNPERFRGADVLVVGVGNSGSEIAAQLAAGGARRVRVSMRTPVNLVPRELLGLPTTVMARLGEAQPAWVGDRLGFAIQRLAFGDLSRHGMPRAPFGIATELRVKGMGAVVDGGFVAALRAGQVELVPPVEGFDAGAVLLAGGRRLGPDAVIAATGYRQGLEPLVGHLGVLSPSGMPAVAPGAAHPGAPGLYFNGFWLPLSGQLPALRRSSRRLARAIERERRPA